MGAMEPHFVFCNGRVFDHVEKSRHCHTHAALIHHQSLSGFTKPGAVQTALRARLFQLLLCHSVPDQCLLPYSGMGAMEPHFFFLQWLVFDHVEKSRHCHKYAALIHHQSLSGFTKPGAVQTALRARLFQLLLCHSVPNQCLLPYSGMGAMEPHFFFFAMAGCLTMLRRAGIVIHMLPSSIVKA